MVRILFLKKFQHAHYNCCNLKLIISYSIQAKDKLFLSTLNPSLDQIVHAQLYSIFLFFSIIITQLLPKSLKSEL